MRGKLWFVGGLAAGFVLGARAGREKYEQLVDKSRKMLDHPTVQEAAGVAQAQANRLYAEGKDKLSHTRLGEKMGEKINNSRGGSAELTDTDQAFASGGPTGVGGTSSTSSTTPTTRSSAPESPGANGTTF